MSLMYKIKITKKGVKRSLKTKGFKEQGYKINIRKYLVEELNK